MKKIGLSLRIIVLSMLLVTSGCAHSIASEQEDMYTLASALTKLTSAMEEKVLFNEAPPEIKDMALVDLAIKHDPRLKEPFSGYVLKARSINGHAVVLVCDKQGRSALLEDGGCSSVIDHHWWRDEPGHPCEVSNAICLKK